MLQAAFSKHIFKFNFPGGTSRGVLTEKPSWFIKVWDDIAPEITGIGEVSIIPGLSPDEEPEIEKQLVELKNNPLGFISNKDELLKNMPAFRFGLEAALLDMESGGKRILYPTPFTNGEQGITINGLVWMGSKHEMLGRIKEKVDAGFSCIKVKIGAINFEDELELLSFIRKTFNVTDLELRVDANGAFSAEEALLNLDKLSQFNIHSIEQPIKQGQWNEMAKLCASTPLPIALDEELIGIKEEKEKKRLLEAIHPQYIILKPSLIGGLAETQKWAQLAINNDIGWWVTSALEGNIGLNAIAQWTAKFGSNMPQGLGTGQVFSNNTDSPLEIRGQKLWYSKGKDWEL